MRQLLHLDILWPISIILLLLLITVYAGSWILKSRGLLRAPIAGIEYSASIISACFILNMLWISSSVIEPLIEMYKALPLSKEFPVRFFLRQAAQLTAIIVFTNILFILLTLLLSLYLPGIRRPLKLIREGNLPLSIIVGMLSFGIAIGLRELASALMEYLAPTVINIY
ncbi:MAG: hypothetical protein QM802_04950 [Agriterribacter sp.]